MFLINFFQRHIEMSRMQVQPETFKLVTAKLLIYVINMNSKYLKTRILSERWNICSWINCEFTIDRMVQLQH
jgi:hypothetical protein